MAYTKTPWKNREVEKPRTFQIQNNPDGTVTLIPKEGNIIEAGTPIIADNMNKIEQGIADAHELAGGIAEHLAENAIHIAAGTANAITVTTLQGNYSYDQFKQLRFKASVNNTGNVTINVDGKGAKPALKFDGTQLAAGAIKAGKVYDWYYDTASGGRFFLIAKASGNAVAEDVLAGKTFSNDYGEFVGLLKKGAVIKSVQRGVSTITTSEPSPLPVAISKVDTSKSFINVHVNGASSSFGNSNVTANFNATGDSIRLYASAPNVNKITVIWEVLEFEEGVSVQVISGTFKTDEGEKTIAISPVNSNRAFVLASYTGNVSSGGTTSSPIPNLTDTSVILTRRSVLYQTDYVMFIIEFI